jgi:hypothetical protein
MQNGVLGHWLQEAAYLASEVAIQMMQFPANVCNPYIHFRARNSSASSPILELN